VFHFLDSVSFQSSRKDDFQVGIEPSWARASLIDEVLRKVKQILFS
jgi:hypothetical protein